MMAATTIGRKIRGTKTALIGAAAATAVAMTVGTTAYTAPGANALTLDTTTTGPLLRIAEALGVDSITVATVPGLGDVTLDLHWTKPDPVGLYDAINAAAFGPFIAGTASRPNIFAGGSTGPLLIATGQSTVAALQTYEALLASANGDTPAGFDPLTPAGKVNSITGQPCSTGALCVQGTNATNLGIALVRNPGTPNGGLYARFAPILNLFGIDPVSPDATSGSSTGLRLNSGLVNVALGYDLLSDFPETLNPFSMANSVLATILPTYLLGGIQVAGADENTIVNNLAALATLGVSSTSYSTLAPNDLPLLEPLRLPSRLLNAVFSAVGVPITLGTPLADALQPAAEILVNVGYTDVQTPSEGGTYNRTYDQSDVYTPYLSVAPLTPAEWAQVPGDVIKALISGVSDVLRPGGAAAQPAQTPAVSAQATPVVTPVQESETADTSTTAPSSEMDSTGIAADVGDDDAAPAATATAAESTVSATTFSTGAVRSRQAKKSGAAAASTHSGTTARPATGHTTHKGVAGSKRAAKSGSAGSARSAS